MPTIDFDLFYRFIVALGIGFIVGLERERKRAKRGDLFAGVRTFAILGLTGCTAALLSDIGGTPWPLITVLLVVGALLVAAYMRPTDKMAVGLTTEIAALLTVLMGALCYWGELTIATALGVLTTLLLSLKLELHTFATRITQEDVYATLKFAVISLIILPILPRQAFGPPPFDVLNLYNVWLMVVLISGISFLGYVLMKVVDPARGIGLTGLLGGLASSTAVTLTFSSRSHIAPTMGGPFALAVILSWGVMFARVVVMVGAVNRALLAELWLPMGAGAVVTLGYAALLYFWRGRTTGDDVTVVNPFELGPAIKIGLLYAVILVVARAAEIYLGDTGIYLSAMVSGVADVNAITLSMAQLSQPVGTLSPQVAAQAIVLAVVSNTVVKGLIVAATAAVVLKKALLPSVPLIAAAAVAAAWFF